MHVEVAESSKTVTFTTRLGSTDEWSTVIIALTSRLCLFPVSGIEVMKSSGGALHARAVKVWLTTLRWSVEGGEAGEGKHESI